MCGKARKYEAWKNAMKQKLPSFIENNQGGGILTFEYTYGRDGSVRYRDGSRKVKSCGLFLLIIPMQSKH